MTHALPYKPWCWPAALLGLSLCGVCTSRAEAMEDIGALDTVVVTGTRTERVIWDSPVRTEVISHDDIERTHARDLKEALQRLPGVQLKQIHGKSGYEVWLQGLNADRVLVLIDGMPVTATTGATVDLSQLSLVDVERIEIVKGPTSAQYGSAAMGGVINVITRAIARGQVLDASIDGGSFGEQNASGDAADINNGHVQVKASNGTDTWRARLSASDNQSDGLDPAPESWRRPGDATRRTHQALRGEWHAAKNAHAYVDLSQLQEDNESRFEVLINNNALGHRKEERADKNRVASGLQWKTEHGSLWQLNAMHERLEAHTQKFSPSRAYDDRETEYTLGQWSGQWQSPLLESPLLNSHVLLVGMDWHPESLQQSKDGVTELVDGTGDRDVSREGHELLLQDDFFIDDQQELLSGVRYQRDSDFGDHVAPKFNYRYSLPTEGSIESAFRIAWGAGYRVPNLKERYYLFDHSQLGYVVTGNPELQPESSSGWQLGWSWRNGDTVTLDTNLFHNRLRDFIQTDFDTEATLDRSDGVAVYRYQNIGRARTQGFEALAGWAPDDAWRFNLGYTWLDTKDRDTGEELTRRARHQSTVGIDRIFSDASLTVSLVARLQSSELVSTENDARSPGWAVIDLKLNYDVTSTWRLFGGLDNLLNRQRNFEDAYDFGPLEGRYLYAGVRYQWENTPPTTD